MVFEEDPEFDIIDVNDCLVELKHDSAQDALLTVELEKQVTKCISDPQNDSTSPACEDVFESKSKKDGILISQNYQRFQKFYETLVKEVLNEWKEKPASDTTRPCRYRSCALRCG